MRGNAFKLKRVQRTVIEVCPGAAGGWLFPNAAVVSAVDGRAGSVNEQRVIVRMQTCAVRREVIATVG